LLNQSINPRLKAANGDYKMKRFLLPASGVMLLLLAISSVGHADVVTKQYRIKYDRATGAPSLDEAEIKAKRLLVEDELKKRLSPKLITEFSEKLAVVLNSPDEFISSFEIISEDFNRDQTERLLTVEGEVDIALVIGTLVQRNMLTFGPKAPRVMIVSSSDQYQKAARSLRARIFDHIQMAGLRLVDDVVSELPAAKAKGAGSPGGVERQSKEYGADFIIQITTEVDAKPVYSGYSTDVNLTYTISRPNNNLILAEATVKGHSSGASQMVAFDKAFDKIAAVVAMRATGGLYQAIFSISEISYGTPRLPQEKTMVVHGAGASIVQAIVAELDKLNVNPKLVSSTSGISSRIRIETDKDDADLYEWFNRRDLDVKGKPYTTLVVAYADNIIEIEAIAAKGVPRKKPVSKGPERKASSQIARSKDDKIMVFPKKQYN
jgi:hypothetical protein